MKKDTKENILFKNLNLFTVYAVVFGVGILIIFFMTSYLNKKVSDFTDSSIGYVDNTNV